jgi:asparagine synthase (glutamine-hydrolysing)
MCGIYGWFDLESSRTPRQLARMGELLSHRGPDDCGTFIDSGAGLALGHNRLSIIDLSPAGHQPMFNEDGTVALVFNGEIYNFRELRSQLTTAGHQFVSRTDSEVLVHAYEEWGPNLVDRLCGMFAFAIWDAHQQSLLVARDPMGIKPLYYWLGPAGDFVFASELKAFLALDSFDPRPDFSMLRQYLELNFIVDTQRTSLVGVRKLPPGCRMQIRRDHLPLRRAPKPELFYRPPAVEPLEAADDAFDQRADRLFRTFDQVVGEHLQADVSVGLLLSGGLDSSLIASVASRKTPIHTISMRFADSSLDETPYARFVAETIGSRHEEVTIYPGEMRDTLEQSVWYVDDLFGDWGIISTMLLYAKCRAAGVKVVLVGEGSDELFGGYPQYETAGGAAADELSFNRRALRLYRWYSGRRWGRNFWRLRQIVRDLDRESERDMFSTIRRFETKHQLPHCYNMKVDKASMAASVEARVPFLDVRIANEAFRTPREALLRGGTNKYLLRYMARRHNLLPSATADRPKVGGSIATDWLMTSKSFRDFAREVILDGDGLTASLGLLDAMRAYFDRGKSGHAFPRAVSIFAIVAWRLLLLNLWARHYLKATLPRQPLAISV